MASSIAWAQDVRLSADIAREDIDVRRDSAEYSVGVDAQFFFKNDEYFAPAAEGYTLPGYRVRPSVQIYIGRFTLTAGVDALRFGGMSRFHKAYPYFAGTWHVTDSVRLRIGDLQGPAVHDLPEILDDPEHQLAGPPETGAMFAFAGRNTKGHVWLNWRQFIFMGDTIPEKFTAGIKVDFLRNSERLRVKLRMMFNHIGGQISNFDEPMQSLANVSVEPEVRLTRSVTAGVMMAGFHTMVGKVARPFEDGFAVQPKIKTEVGIVSAEASWLRTRNFYAPHGNPLLMSVSNYDPAVYEKDRSLVIVHADINKAFPSVRFNLRGSAYYDTFASRLDYAYFLGLCFSPRWYGRLPRMTDRDRR
ncbi:MAG: hypothetical protein II951_03750 [Bacteroidales bacterium]|nr:hypothetical protein [Bacteroidales bacterium]